MKHNQRLRDLSIDLALLSVKWNMDDEVSEIPGSVVVTDPVYWAVELGADGDLQIALYRVSDLLEVGRVEGLDETHMKGLAELSYILL